MKNKKSKWDELKPEEFKPKLSYTRYKDGTIVPQGMLGYHPPREKREFWPNEGVYKTKLTRGGK